jgi:V8-like Glu-specific endopeptidase
MRSRAVLLTLSAAFAAALCFMLSAPKPAFSVDDESDAFFAPVDPAREQRELAELEKLGKAFGGKPIYGNDDRMDWGKIFDRKVKAAAAASVALIDRIAFAEEESGKLRLRAFTLEELGKLCPNQRFLKQYSSAFCSGILVGEDLVATAGHCIAEVAPTKGARRLSNIQFVFGYTANSQQDPGRALFDKREVFAARELVGGKNQGDEDWALVRLDRPVPKETAAPVKKIRKTRIEDGAPIFVVGYPIGLPLKYAPDAAVRSNESAIYFTANLDTFEGNSGSGVFSAVTQELVGILTGGADDYHEVYHRSQGGKCREAYLCGRDGCSGETVTRIELIEFPSGDATRR